MSPKLTGCVLVGLLLALTAGGAAAQGPELRIALAQHDEFAFRTFTVTRVSGEAVARLVAIDRLDRDAEALVFEDVAGRAVTIPVAEISGIAFIRVLRGDSMAVQAARRQVTADVRDHQTLTVPAEDLAIEAGELVLKESGPALAPVPGERWEARALAYDAAADAFRLEVERVKYTVTVTGGGGSSGGSKGLP